MNVDMMAMGPTNTAIARRAMRLSTVIGAVVCRQGRARGQSSPCQAELQGVPLDMKKSLLRLGAWAELFCFSDGTSDSNSGLFASANNRLRAGLDRSGRDLRAAGRDLPTRSAVHQLGFR